MTLLWQHITIAVNVLNVFIYTKFEASIFTRSKDTSRYLILKKWVA